MTNDVVSDSTKMFFKARISFNFEFRTQMKLKVNLLGCDESVSEAIQLTQKVISLVILIRNVSLPSNASGWDS